jgi:uncharacterized iron-regulated membrane protein
MGVVVRILLSVWFGLVVAGFASGLMMWRDARHEHTPSSLREAVAARHTVAGAVFFAVLTISLFVLGS